MLSKETAGQIWDMHEQIARGKRLLADLEESLEKYQTPTSLDAFGRRQGLQLGVPSGPSSHTVYDVRPELAISIIKAHIAHSESRLVALNESARAEMLAA